MSRENKRVVLIKPPLYTDRTFGVIRTAQPLGIWQLGSYLQAKGYQVKIIDSVVEGWENKAYLETGSRFDCKTDLEKKVTYLKTHSIDNFREKYPTTDSQGNIQRTLIRTGLSENEIIDRIREFNPAWIGLSIIATCEHRSAIDLAKLLKGKFPSAKIVAGGQHATDMPEKVLRDAEGSIDFVVRGNGEFTFENLLEGKKPERGLAYFKNGGLIVQQDALLTPLEKLPVLDPNLLRYIDYILPATHTYGTNGRKYTDFMASFGCHNRCDFCRQGTLRDGYRHFSMEHLKKQLRVFKESGIEEIVLQDDSLLGSPRTDGKQFFLELVRVLKDNGVYWQDNGGIEFERLDEETANAIISENEKPGEAKCTALYVPFNPRTIRQTRITEKHQKRTDKIKLLQRLKESGIYTFTSGIWGHVNQDCSDMQSEINGYEFLLKEKVVDQVVVFGLSYLPRTLDWNYRDLIVDQEDWEGYSIFVPHAGTIKASFEEVSHYVLKAYNTLNKHQPHVEPWASAFPLFIPNS